VNDIAELDKYYNELIFTVCKGSPTEMNELKRFDVFDFFDYIDNKSKNG
jgi:hypothetical protein